MENQLFETAYEVVLRKTVFHPELLKSPRVLRQHLHSHPTTHHPSPIYSLHLGLQSSPCTKTGRNHRNIPLKVSLLWAIRKLQLFHSPELVKQLTWNGCLERSLPQSGLKAWFSGLEEVRQSRMGFRVWDQGQGPLNHKEQVGHWGAGQERQKIAPEKNPELKSLHIFVCR